MAIIDTRRQNTSKQMRNQLLMMLIKRKMADTEYNRDIARQDELLDRQQAINSQSVVRDLIKGGYEEVFPQEGEDLKGLVPVSDFKTKGNRYFKEIERVPTELKSFEMPGVGTAFAIMDQRGKSMGDWKFQKASDVKLNEMQLVFNQLKEQLKREPTMTEWSEAIKQRRIDIYKGGRSVFATQGTNVPGIVRERETGRLFITDKAGKRTYIDYETAKKMAIQYEASRITASTKNMRQAAPHVEEFAKLVKNSLENLDPNVGPIKGRWADFWAGKVGIDDPVFIDLKTNVHLMRTMLMKMHIGSNSSEKLFEDFARFLDEGYHSKANMMSATNAILAYANRIRQMPIEEMNFMLKEQLDDTDYDAMLNPTPDDLPDDLISLESIAFGGDDYGATSTF